MNQLANETSPYLLQHADNPVDWMPWGDAAFARARQEDKPLLVSIGYSACHWCHVMERESFTDQRIAALMNDLYVCVKVDREERPDVDAIYMNAVQAMTGAGGWPLNAFLLPDGLPFFCGTYFPPQQRGEAASWEMVLRGVHEAYRDKRDEIESTRDQLVQNLSGAAGIDGRAGELPESLLQTAVDGIRRTYDAQRGGFGGAPKFPQASVIEFLLGQGEREMSIHTLRAMANGGIYDQIGGGFARYATDAAWVIPHFEKMLYDNALLARAYLHAFQATGNAFLRRVCEETLDFMLRELRQEEGAFASALDADSEGVEGKFYVWTLDEVTPAQAAYFGMTAGGNWEGKNIPVRAAPDPPELREWKAELLARREQRVRPALDDKRLTAWNALAISALADAGAVLGREDYVSAARAAAGFVLDTMRDGEGRLLRTYNRGQARLNAYLEDHGYLLEALLTLYEATFEARWFTAARELADQTIARFHDAERGGFFTTASDHEQLLTRRKDLEDTPIPAGQSAVAYGLLRLGALTGEHGYTEAAETVIRPLGEPATRFPGALGHALQAMAFSRGPVHEVALIGDDVTAFLEVVRAEFRPRLVLAGGAGDVPLLEGRTAPGAYVCEGFQCQAPTTDPAALAALLTPPPRT